MSTDDLPVPWDPANSPESPAEWPKLDCQLAMDFFNAAFDLNKRWHQANAAKEQTKVLETLNRPVKRSVKKIAVTCDGLAGSHKQAARSVHNNVNIASSAVSSSATALKKAAEQTIHEVHGVRLALQSLSISAVAVAVIMQQILNEMRATNRILGGIREELWRSNLLTPSSGAGSDGFAEVMYNIVAMEAAKTQFARDHFFVWHPDTSWHPAFYAKLRQSPLPITFRGESDCLDRLRPAAFAARGIEHDGGIPVVTLVLPRPQPTLTLNGVGNLYEEKPTGPTPAYIASVVSHVATMLGSRAGGMGVALAVGLPTPFAPIVLGVCAFGSSLWVIPSLNEVEAAF
ncbi:hypothetical protein PWT90_06243 [Aphanocladium album]|nr:hypothetical protein PWT90_06243 [Aphanocladium album]